MTTIYGVPGWRMTAIGSCAGTVCHVTPLVPMRQRRLFDPPAVPTGNVLAARLFNWVTRSPCSQTISHTLSTTTNSS